MAAEKPSSVRIRAYDVGFGDCLLLSFRYPARERHVLVDFGSHPKPRRKAAGDLAAIAAHIKRTCGGELTAVVATHRHADHINGFATTRKGDGPGDVIASCRPKVVVQPWTEQLDAAVDSAGPQRLALADRVHATSIAELSRFCAALTRRLADPPAGWRGAVAELGFLGELGLANAAAVKNLESMAPKRGRRYVYSGTDSGLGAVLPGVKVRVLGPPTISQSEGVQRQRKRDDAEYWHLTALTTEAAGPTGRAPFARRFRRDTIPGFARWLVTHADRLSREQILGIVRRMDEVLNNTSVVLLLDVAGTRILLAGDAQIENWSYALSKPDVRALLADVAVYKVGHHGSLNATPKASLWERFRRRNAAAGRLVTVLSTESKRHGSAKSRTEVPRKTLLDALQAESRLLSTEDPDVRTTEGNVAYVERTIPLGGAARGARPLGIAAARELAVTFSGAVVTVHVSVEGVEVPLADVGGDKWKGSEAREIAGGATVKLTFAAPARTDYALTVRYGGAKLVDDEGTSQTPRFSKSYQVVAP